MTGKHHATAGLCTAGCLTVSAILEQNAGMWLICGMAAAAYAGSLFPDIDTRTSKMSKRLKIASKIVNHLFGHRGFFHSPLFVFLVYFLCRWIFIRKGITEYRYIYLGFVAGMTMHLACDMLTKGGLPLLYPWTRKRFRISTLESGCKWEHVSLAFICVLALAATGFLLYKRIYLGSLFP